MTRESRVVALRSLLHFRIRLLEEAVLCNRWCAWTRVSGGHRQGRVCFRLETGDQHDDSQHGQVRRNAAGALPSEEGGRHVADGGRREERCEGHGWSEAVGVGAIENLRCCTIGSGPAARSQQGRSCSSERPVDVVVVISKPGNEARASSEVDFVTAHPNVQAKVWESVVKISSEGVCSGTALVVDQTPTHLYLLTNLHLWDGVTFAKHLSADFKAELVQYRKKHPKLTVELSGAKRKRTEEMAKEPLRRSARIAARHTPTVLLEHCNSTTSTLTEVLRFSLHPSVCWRCSAEFDYAIFKVEAADNMELIHGEIPMSFFDPGRVDVYGFPEDKNSGRSVIPARVTSWRKSQMTPSFLAAPGVFRSAVVCTKGGLPVGYIGRGFGDPSKNEPYQSNAFTFHGFPSLL